MDVFELSVLTPRDRHWRSADVVHLGVLAGSYCKPNEYRSMRGKLGTQHRVFKLGFSRNK